VDYAASVAVIFTIQLSLHKVSEIEYSYFPDHLILTRAGLTCGRGFPEAGICDCWEPAYAEGAMPAIVLRSDWDAARVRTAARAARDGTKCADCSR
jgi:hypothetical protein